MSDFKVSRERHKRAIDPCLGFYVSSTGVSNHEEETLSDLDAAFVPVLTPVLGEHRTTIGHMVRHTHLVAEPLVDSVPLAGADNYTLKRRNDLISSSCAVSLVDCPSTPESREALRHRLNTFHPPKNGETTPMTVEKFLRLSAAATKNDRAFKMARYNSKRNRRFRVLEKSSPTSKYFTHTEKICEAKATASAGSGSTSLHTGSLDADRDSIQLRSRKIRRKTLTSPVLDQMANGGSDIDTPRQFSAEKSSGDEKQLTKRQRKMPTTKKINERLFEALVLTHGHPDETLIQLDPNKPDSPHRGPLHFVPQDSAVHEGRKRTTGNFVNPRRSLAIRSATLSIPMRHVESGTRMGSVLNRWPANVVQRNKVMTGRHIHHSDHRQAQRAGLTTQNRSTTASFDSHSNDRRHPLTFTDAVCAERSYTRMFSSVARIGPLKPKPEKNLSSTGIIDLSPIENGGVFLKRLSSKEQYSEDDINAAESIDGSKTLGMLLSTADSPMPWNDNQEIPDLADSDGLQSASLNPALHDAVVSIMSDNSSPGTGTHNVLLQSPQTAKNTLQRGARSDNLNLYGGETAQSIHTSLNKPLISLASLMEHCQRAIQRGSVAENKDIDSRWSASMQGTCHHATPALAHS